MKSKSIIVIFTLIVLYSCNQHFDKKIEGKWKLISIDAPTYSSYYKNYNEMIGSIWYFSSDGEMYRDWNRDTLTLKYHIEKNTIIFYDDYTPWDSLNATIQSISDNQMILIFEDQSDEFGNVVTATFKKGRKIN